MRSWPQDRVEHELESISAFLRGFPQCPEEVRIREGEGGAELPMIMIEVVSTESTDYGPHFYDTIRDISLMWYGDPSGDQFQAKNQVVDWLLHTLVRNDERHRGLIKIQDYSDPEDIVETGYWISIDHETVSVEPRKDEYGNWTIACEFTYSVDHRPGVATPSVPTPPSVPAITDVIYEVNID